MRRRAAARAWPHGQPTMVCPACEGSGLNRARAFQYLGSSAVTGDPIGTAESVRCDACEGRGRQTIARVQFDRSR